MLIQMNVSARKFPVQGTANAMNVLKITEIRIAYRFAYFPIMMGIKAMRVTIRNLEHALNLRINAARVA